MNSENMERVDPRLAAGMRPRISPRAYHAFTGKQKPRFEGN